MSIQTWHLLGVAVPYVLIATALWGITSGAVKDAVAVGSIPARFSLGRSSVSLPTVPVAYALGFMAVAFIYGCALDRNHMGSALGADPHAMAPGADAYLYGLAVVSWISAALLVAPYVWLRRGTRALLSAPAERDHAEARYRLLAENLTDLICHHQPDGRYEWLSPSVETILGYPPEALVGQDPYELFHPEDRARIRSESHEQILNGKEANTLIRYRIRHSEGHYIWLESLTETIRSAAGELISLQVTSRDVTERQAIEEELQRQAHHDPLTNLANRTLLTLRLDALVASGETDFAVLYLDLDRFKAVNDTLGHSVGDELLVQLAARLRGEARHGDTVARIGGDEFALLLTGVRSEDEAVAAAERVSRVVHVPFDLGGTMREVTLSIGIVLGRADQKASGDVLREADLAAYDAKDNGRAGWRMFTPALREASERRRRLEADLERAAERNELRVAYQPIVRLSDGAFSGMEALVRWEHPELGLLSPDVFISIAEEIGRIGEVDRWVMQEGLRQFERWEEEMGREINLSLSVNCSARDLHEPRFTERVRAIVGENPRRADRLTLEITESLLVDNPQRAAAVLHELRGEGLRFSMDDFGTGYSSLSVIHALPVDTVKVDRAFVQRMHEDASALAMVSNVIDFAQTLGKDIVAEGIETVEHLAALQDMGCEYGQGYLFGRPLAPEAMSALFRAEMPSWAPLWKPVRA